LTTQVASDRLVPEATMAADKSDAALLVQLAQWGTMIGLDAAVAAIFDDGFDSESATTDDDAHVRTVLQFGATLGTLTKHGVLDTGLVTDWLWVAGLWERVGPAARRDREELRSPTALREHGAPRQRAGLRASAWARQRLTIDPVVVGVAAVRCPLRGRLIGVVAARRGLRVGGRNQYRADHEQRS